MNQEFQAMLGKLFAPLIALGPARFTVLLVMGALLIGASCQPPPTNNNDTSGGDTSGGDTSGGDTSGGDTSGGDTSGGDTSGGDTSGGDTSGGDTSGGDTSGGDTSGGDTSGGDTSGGDTSGGDTSGDDTSGGDPGLPVSITLSNLVQTGDPVPGQPAGTTFVAFSSPIIDAEGRVAFWATHEGGNGNGGLYVWEADTVRLVVDDDPAGAGDVPGGSAAEYFGNYVFAGGFDPFSEAITWGSTGRLLFVSRIAGGSGRNGLFRWRASDDDLIRVADSDMIKNDLGLNATIFIAYFENQGVSDAGLVLFRVRYVGLGEDNPAGSAVCVSNGLTVTPIAPLAPLVDVADVGAVPDQTESGFPNSVFAEYREQTTLSTGGQMLFQGKYENGTGSHGVYLSVNGGDPVRVVDNRPSLSLPGLIANITIGASAYYDALAIGSNDHIAIDTEITEAGEAREAVILWDWDAGEWTELSPGGGVATALISGVSSNGIVVILDENGEPYVATPNSVVSLTTSLPPAFTAADLEWSTDCGSINNYGRVVLHYRRTDGDTPGLAFWTGATMLVLADPTRSLPAADVTDIVATQIPETDRPGRSGLLNDNDEAVFRVTFSGGDQAIYAGRGQQAD
ncbi:MAG: hypothetical protein ABIG44_06170 [Planctomycetota bacterium]